MAMELAQVVASAQQGDKQAFYRLYQQFVPRVYAICWRLLANKQKAEDASQEVFIKVYRKIDTWKPTGGFLPWILRMIPDPSNPVSLRLQRLCCNGQSMQL